MENPSIFKSASESHNWHRRQSESAEKGGRAGYHPARSRPGADAVDERDVKRSPRFPHLMFLFATELPFEAVDDTFDTRLEDVGSNADGSPSVHIVREYS